MASKQDQSNNLTLRGPHPAVRMLLGMVSLVGGLAFGIYAAVSWGMWLGSAGMLLGILVALGGMEAAAGLGRGL